MLLLEGRRVGVTAFPDASPPPPASPPLPFAFRTQSRVRVRVSVCVCVCFECPLCICSFADLFLQFTRRLGGFF